MAYSIDVPFISQWTGFAGQSIDDWLGCWYASACMVAYAYEPGPRLGVPSAYGKQTAPGGGTWTGHAALLFPQFKKLAKNEGLVEVTDAASKKFTVAEIEALLRSGGPILFCYNKTRAGKTYGHAGCIYGADAAKDEILFHDPEDKPRTKINNAYLEARRLRFAFSMLHRNSPIASGS